IPMTLLDSERLDEVPGEPTGPAAPGATEPDRLASLEARVERSAMRRDGWLVFILLFSGLALLAAIVAVGLGSRAIDESKRNVQASAPTSASSAPASGTASPVPAPDTVHLREFSI